MRVVPIALIALPVVVGGIGITAALVTLGAPESPPPAVDDRIGDRASKTGAVSTDQAPTPDVADGTEIDGRRPYLTVIDAGATLAPPGTIPGVLSLLPPPSTELPPLSDLLPEAVEPAERAGLPLVLTPVPPSELEGATVRGESSSAAPDSDELARPGTDVSPDDDRDGHGGGAPGSPGGRPDLHSPLIVAPGHDDALDPPVIDEGRPGLPALPPLLGSPLRPGVGAPGGEPGEPADPPRVDRPALLPLPPLFLPFNPVVPPAAPADPADTPVPPAVPADPADAPADVTLPPDVQADAPAAPADQADAPAPPADPAPPTAPADPAPDAPAGLDDVPSPTE